MKKIISLILVAFMLVSLVACGGAENATENSSTDNKGVTNESVDLDNADLSDLTIGLICLHDENSTYDLNFINSMKDAQKALGLSDDQIVYKYNVPEGEECTDAAIDLIESYDCDIVFANSFGHESFLMLAAEDYPEVEFCHATGTMAHTEDLDNFHNAFASIYEGRYLAGIAAGMKINEMIEAGTITADQAKIGYVGAFKYAEVKSGYTSFYLGAKSVCPSVTMEVKFTESWYDENKEKEAANALIESDCVLISQHADSMGAPSACEQAGVPNVSYNGSTINSCPNTFIVSSRIDWSPYYQYAVACWANGVEIADDWCGGIAEGSVVLTDINTNVAAEGTQEAIDAAINQFKAGTLNVFDTKNFTVAGVQITSYKADVDTDAAYTADTEVIENGVFYESKYRSAPYFDLDIDGITLN